MLDAWIPAHKAVHVTELVLLMSLILMHHRM